jgi:hypothetical protein
MVSCKQLVKRLKGWPRRFRRGDSRTNSGDLNIRQTTMRKGSGKSYIARPDSSAHSVSMRLPVIGKISSARR